MLIEAKDDYPSTWSAIQAIAPKIGCVSPFKFEKCYYNSLILSGIAA